MNIYHNNLEAGFLDYFKRMKNIWIEMPHKDLYFHVKQKDNSAADDFKHILSKIGKSL